MRIFLSCGYYIQDRINKCSWNGNKCEYAFCVSKTDTESGSQNQYF